MAVTGAPNEREGRRSGSGGEDQVRGFGVSGAGGGPGGWGPGGWGPGGFGGPGGHGGRGERAPAVSPKGEHEITATATTRRTGHGELRAAILLLLDEWPMTAVRLTRVIYERSGTVWAVDRSAMRSALSSLEDEALVSRTRVGGRSTASLTPDGIAFVDMHRVALGEPWDDVEGRALRVRTANVDPTRGVTGPGVHFAGTGSEARAARGAEALREVRDSLDRILAEDEETH
jgi:DNA-binding PadR family transcriptional regulator